MTYKCSKCGKELTSEKFCPECGQEVVKELASETPNPSTNEKIIWGIIAIICIVASFFNEDYSPRTPNDLECINHKNLCIATTDVKYDYTTIKTRTLGFPAFGKEWNNGWASAEKACEAWGGRLPYMEDFVTILDAYNNEKIRLKEYGTYLSATQINAYRIWAYRHGTKTPSKTLYYDTTSIYDTAVSIEKTGDNFITGHYDTNPAYTWNARCVKPLY